MRLAWTRRRGWTDFLVCSNLLYAVIGGAYAEKGMPFRGALLVASGATSFAYHSSGEQFASTADQVVLVTAALYFKYVVQSPSPKGEGYWAPHCAWHLLVAMGQALCVAALPYSELSCQCADTT
ncbi:hypothetical protein EMIHUDRAFT_227993 [Emiliania huxleyi CCMP1516]|uniref:Uncharacterized protein n=2 Tax=Emiliania huxleyi TaxID=2903 RepID=A0A0D3KGT0_EMIH1|nr:hypothetical protein EMIHUDRAFT_227993 [Emiliania huxleyi CCMP1516]EOD34965.1 hypothetical protein EMIHUDRAFT_227993 [Emiliania huxleyi CCMP1516]|eukprot:XP_005787394.1 hypothetical protein EMIHUDRAFT_227993 [Emiliania huxleyi CCMP1516]